MNKKVDFAIVGFPRCATSSVHYTLDKSKYIRMSNPKETGYFNRIGIFRSKVEKSLFEKAYHQWCFNYFENDRKVVTELFGDATPSHITSVNSIREMAYYNKKMKIIVMIRNPIDRSFSQWWRSVKNHDEDNLILDIEKNPGLKRIVLDWSNYVKYLKIVKSYFPLNQIHVVMFDDLKENYEGEIIKIYRFLGVDDENEVCFRHENNSSTRKDYRKPTNNEINFLHDSLDVHTEKLEIFLESDLKHWLR